MPPGNISLNTDTTAISNANTSTGSSERAQASRLRAVQYDQRVGKQHERHDLQETGGRVIQLLVREHDEREERVHRRYDVAAAKDAKPRWHAREDSN